MKIALYIVASIVMFTYGALVSVTFSADTAIYDRGVMDGE